MPIQRVFLDWSQPALPAAVDFLIRRFASRSQLDLSRVVVVFPGRRAARRALEILVQRAGTQWPALIPPRMVTFQQFPELLYPQQRQLADDLTQLLVWKQAISCIPPGELQAALPQIPAADSVPAWQALCQTLRRQHDELAAEGMEFDEVHLALAQAGNAREADRWRALRRIQAEYLVRMDDLGLWDRQAARLVAVQQQECTTQDQIILTGTVDMNRIVRQMLDQVADQVTALIHAPESEAASFDEYGCLVPTAWQLRSLNIPLEITRVEDTPAEQARAVVAELRTHGIPYRPDEISVGIADESLVPTVLQHLADAGLTGHWSVGRPIEATRPGRLLRAVADYLASARDGMPPDFPSLSNLVRHPDLDPWIRSAVAQAAGRAAPVDWLTLLDHYLADHLQTVPTSLVGDAPRRRIIRAICDSVDQLLHQLVERPQADRPAAPLKRRRSPSGRQPTGRSTAGRSVQRQLTLDDQSDAAEQSSMSPAVLRRSLREWVDGCFRMLTAIYRDRELHDEEPSDRGIVACLEAIRDTAETLRRVPDAIMPRCSAAHAIQMLLREISSAHVPPRTSENDIDLLGWLELPLDDSPFLILTGFNEGFVPESVVSDVFLPNSLRTQLGLTDNSRRYARDAYAVSVLLHSRRHLTVIAGRRDAQHNPLAPSRLWFAADPPSLPRRVREFYDEVGQHTGAESGPHTDPDSGSHTDGAPASTDSANADLDGTAPEARPSSRLSGFTVPRPPLIPDPPHEIPVTAFRDYIQCPYRSYLRRELRLRAVEDRVRELTAPAFGSLMHEVLNRFGLSAVRDSTTPESIEVFLLKELQQVASRRFGRLRSATLSVQLKMLENRLQGFAIWQARTASEGWRIAHTEEDLQFPEFHDCRGRTVNLVGRIDRIDQHRTSKAWRVLDYKTSESAERPETTHRRKDQWVDLQLPLYRLLVKALGIHGDVQLGYVHLPGDLSRIGCSIAEWDEADLRAAENLARDVAADIIDLRIDRVAPGQDQQVTEFSRLCQDTVIDRSIPWLADWPGRST